MGALFEVIYCNAEYGHPIYKVYHIDAANNRFLVVNNYSRFMWVNIVDCELIDG